MRWTALDPEIVRAIAEAVERQGGDFTDVEDLIEVWERVNRHNSEHADRIHAQAAQYAERYSARETS